MINSSNFSELISFDQGERVTHILALSYSLNPRMLQELILGCGFDLNEHNFNSECEKIACFVQHDRGSGDFFPHQNNILALRLLEKKRVFLQKSSPSFHPKLWGFLYQKEGNSYIRLIISSRNLSSNNQLEGAICLDAQVDNSSNDKIGKANEPLTNLLKDLSTHTTPDSTVAAFVEAIEKTDFSSCIPNCTLSFLTPQTGLDVALLASASCDKFVAISPFLGKAGYLNSFFRANNITLITRSTSYNDATLDVNPKYLTKDVDGTEEISLHGKIYCFDGVETEDDTSESHL